MEGGCGRIFFKFDSFLVDLHVLRMDDSIKNRKYHRHALASLKIQREGLGPSVTQPKARNKKGRHFIPQKPQKSPRYG